MPSIARRPSKEDYDAVELTVPYHVDDLDIDPANPFQSNRNLPPVAATRYPPVSSEPDVPSGSTVRRVHIPENPGQDIQRPYDPYDPERGQRSQTPRMPEASMSPSPGNSRNSSWDLMSGIKKFEHTYEEFDSRNASQAHLAFADGDVPNNKLSKLYNYLLNVSIVTRWIIFIVPVLGLIWIPGILGLTSFRDATIWGTRLLWWSIWLSVIWGGWWGSLAAARLLPPLIRRTIGVVAVGTRRYIDWMEALYRYVALFAWTLASWITFNPLIDKRQLSTASDSSVSTINLIGKLWFALFLCAALLLFEKFSIQWIAGKFHERSYAERIADQKFAVRALVTLYRHSSDIPGRTDTLRSGPATKRATMDPRKFLKKALKGVRLAATTTTTAFGNVASEITGSSVLQPNSPQAMVKTALESANKSRLLARRLFYSFAKPGSDYLYVEDIARFFPNGDDADNVFGLFDKDSNGDASRDEVEMACLEFHREQLSIEHSMQDLDSAVGRLDNILMSVYVVVAMLIIAVALEAQLATLVTGAGTIILGLSWLIGASLQEVLTSIIFLFIKHPFDVGDRINLEKTSYTVKEIRLLSTVFLDSTGTVVQAPNMGLNSMFIQNIRRSPQMSEPFTFDVNYATTFEDLEKLRVKMVAFLESERRDFQPVFDVSVVDFPDQEKMVLSADIKYKSNTQQGALKAKRRNKWICALKTALGELKIFGPKGDPDATPPTTRYTEVPWEKVEAEERKSERAGARPGQPGQSDSRSLGRDWQLSAQNAVIVDSADDIFGEQDELNMTSPRRDLSSQGVRPSAVAAVSMPTAIAMPSALPSSSKPEMTEMTPRI